MKNVGMCGQIRISHSKSFSPGATLYSLRRVCERRDYDIKLFRVGARDGACCVQNLIIENALALVNNTRQEGARTANTVPALSQYAGELVAPDGRGRTQAAFKIPLGKFDLS
jgi:hypothetical protein